MFPIHYQEYFTAVKRFRRSTAQYPLTKGRPSIRKATSKPLRLLGGLREISKLHIIYSLTAVKRNIAAIRKY